MTGPGNDAGMERRWPEAVWLVRHGESSGNVARDRAEASGAAMIDIAERDMDVPLSPAGEEQARALGRWLAEQQERDWPCALLTSPYVRARRTAELVLEGAGRTHGEVELIVDERLREREFGILDRLTKAGIKERYPEQAEYRSFLGKFYHRPPGGESWADVVLRLRSALDTISREYEGERVMVVTHQVVILMFRYLFEQLSEEDVLEIDRQHELGNCSLTTFELDPNAGRHGRMVLRDFNEVAPIAAQGAPVTRERDVPVAPG